MKKIDWFKIGIAISILLFLLGFILFNDISFILIGLGVIVLGIIIIIKINMNSNRR